MVTDIDKQDSPQFISLNILGIGNYSLPNRVTGRELLENDSEIGYASKVDKQGDTSDVVLAMEIDGELSDLATAITHDATIKFVNGSSA